MDFEIVVDTETCAALNRKPKQFGAVVRRGALNDPELLTLDLTEFLGRGWYDAECTRLVQRALRCNTHVTRICLRFNEVGDNDVPALVAMIQLQPALTALDVANNCIGAVKELAEALSTNPSLRALDLSFNRIPPAGAQALAAMLRTNAALTELDIGGNPFGEVGAIHLIEAVKYNGTLLALGLQAMDLPPKLLDSVEAALRVNFSALQD